MKNKCTNDKKPYQKVIYSDKKSVNAAIAEGTPQFVQGSSRDGQSDYGNSSRLTVKDLSNRLDTLSANVANFFDLINKKDF
ncbi:hypothetical protein HWV62_26753 [Athelia sp. TMB]|nr:hypothetical protein HWV62_26753 [Athelia sp. TMB]